MPDPIPLLQKYVDFVEIISAILVYLSIIFVILIIIDFSFNLKFNKIMVGIDCKDTKSLKLFERLGFKILGKDEIINYQY